MSMKGPAEWKERFFQALPENNRLERIWFIAKTDFKKRYYGSWLGLFWALLNPLFRLGIYYTVFTIVFENSIENFALFLFLGLILYMFFAEAGSKGMSILKSKSYLLENSRIDNFDIYYASILSILFALIFNLVIYLGVTLIIVPEAFSLRILLFPLILFNLILFTLAAKVLLSVIWLYFKDIQHLWDLVRLALLWLSGIFFQITPGEGWKSTAFFALTPLSGIIHNSRAVLLYNEPIAWDLMAYDYLYALVLMGLAYTLFVRSSSRALELI